MSKPMGPIPAGFGEQADILTIGGHSAEALVEAAGDTPLFVYDLKRISERIALFRHVFPGIKLHYAMKANSFAPLLRWVNARVDGIDLASEGELRMALAAGAGGRNLSFAGPGKRVREIEAAIRAGVTLNCESEGEAERIVEAGGRLGSRPLVAVRVNPDFELKGAGMRMGGGAKPFGVDAVRVPGLVRWLVDRGADYRGLHIFAGSQSLDAEALVHAQRLTVDAADQIAQESGLSPPLVNLGGGFGIPYVAGDRPLDVERIGEALADRLASRGSSFAETEFAIELGRWLVGEAGVYLTRIVDRKVSQGRVFLVADGGLHHQLAASGNFGQVIRRNYPVAIASRFGAPPEEEVSIVGCLCTPLDRLADDVMMPRAEVGDLVAVFLAGAYGLSASPQQFLAQSPALELAVAPDGSLLQ